MTRLVLSAGVLLVTAIGVQGADSAQADPSAPAEVKFLNDVHSHMQRYGYTRAEDMSDAVLVGEGWSACHDLAIGVSPRQLGIDPLIGDYAAADLCPHGCPQGCSHRQQMG
jgi:hypothetical protein